MMGHVNFRELPKKLQDDVNYCSDQASGMIVLKHGASIIISQTHDFIIETLKYPTDKQKSIHEFIRSAKMNNLTEFYDSGFYCASGYLSCYRYGLRFWYFIDIPELNKSKITKEEWEIIY